MYPILWHIATSVMYSQVHLADKNPVWFGVVITRYLKLAQGQCVYLGWRCSNATAVHACVQRQWCARGMQLSKGVSLSACVTLYSPHVSVVREALLQGVPSILKLCWNGFDNGFRHSCSVASTGGVNV